MSIKVLQDRDHGGVAKLTNLPTPSASSEAATKGYVDSAVEGLAWKDSVRVASTANINLTSPGATIDGITMVALDRFLAKNQTTTTENGIYIWNGAAAAATRAIDCDTAAELEQAITTVEEGTSAGSSFRQTLVNFTLGSGSPAWASFGTAAPAASTSVAGVVQIATQSEVDTGTDTLKSLTPATLASWSGRIKKFSATLGDGAATQYDISHNLNSRDCVVQVYRTATPWDVVECDIEKNTVNIVRLRFAAAPASGAYTVVVIS